MRTFNKVHSRCDFSTALEMTMRATNMRYKRRGNIRDKQRENIGRGNLIEIIKASCWTSFSISLQGGIFNTENHKPQTENCQLLSATADCWFVFSLYSFLFYLMSNISILLTTNWRLLLPTWSRASCSYSEPREFWIRITLRVWVLRFLNGRGIKLPSLAREGLGMRAFDELRSRCDFSTALEMTNGFKSYFSV